MPKSENATPDRQEEPVAIAGAGRVGQALGRLLIERRWPVVAVASRTEVHARQAADFIGAGVAAVSYSELKQYAARFLICVADDAIAGVAEQLAVAGVNAGIAVHTSGVHGCEPMAALVRVGVSCGTLHPLQTIATPAQGVQCLPSAFFAVSGDGAAASWAEQLVRSFGAEALRLDIHSRPLYHAAAVLASNGVVGLIDAAVILLQRAGIDALKARLALAPLVGASVTNAFALTPEQALTGPIQRGDIRTIRTHVNALAAAPTSVAEVYYALGRHIIDVARRGGLDPETAGKLEAILSGRSRNDAHV